MKYIINLCSNILYIQRILICIEYIYKISNYLAVDYNFHNFDACNSYLSDDV